MRMNSNNFIHCRIYIITKAILIFHLFTNNKNIISQIGYKIFNIFSIKIQFFHIFTNVKNIRFKGFYGIIIIIYWMLRNENAAVMYLQLLDKCASLVINRLYSIRLSYTKATSVTIPFQTFQINVSGLRPAFVLSCGRWKILQIGYHN